ncbi:MAG: protein kinase [Sandaracinaceae bacterium]
MADELDALLKAGRVREAAAIVLADGDHVRASELYASIWDWPEAIRTAEAADRFDLAYRWAVSGDDRVAAGRVMEELARRPAQADAAAEVAESRGRPLDAARLLEAAGRPERAAGSYERAGELADAARLRLALGEVREAGILYERRVREAPGDRASALALGRILAGFGRWDHAARALQAAAEDPEHRPGALRLLIACFHALGLDEAAGSRLHALRQLEPDRPATVPAFLEEVYGDPEGVRGLGAGPEGERLLAGRYRVTRRLGAGATGRVLLAHDAFYERPVAVKVLTVGGAAAGRDAYVRFAREARLAASIEHPNVVKVFDYHPDGPFLVMEYMAGGTLADRLRGPREEPLPYPPDRTEQVARAVLRALEVVHRRGVVHRDLKPPNVFFSEAGEVKLGDFGVAHLTDLGATLTGALIGTLAYMAPEQITGRERPGAATDLYALGVILYRCLTGRLPFPGPDFVTQHLEGSPPAASEVAPALGTAFDAALATLLAREPSARPVSASAALELLRPLPWRTATGPEVVSQPVAERSGAGRAAAPSAERYRTLEPLPGTRPGTSLALDELLDRRVEVVPVDAAEAARLRTFAAADGPFLQAVYQLDEASGRAVLEHPGGLPWAEAGVDDRRRAEALAQVGEALDRLHEHGLVHGAVDADHVLLGEGRAVLRLPTEPRNATAQQDRDDLHRLPFERAREEGRRRPGGSSERPD